MDETFIHLKNWKMVQYDLREMLFSEVSSVYFLRLKYAEAHGK